MRLGTLRTSDASIRQVLMRQDCSLAVRGSDSGMDGWAEGWRRFLHTRALTSDAEGRAAAAAGAGASGVILGLPIGARQAAEAVMDAGIKGWSLLRSLVYAR